MKVSCSSDFSLANHWQEGLEVFILITIVALALIQSSFGHGSMILFITSTDSHQSFCAFTAEEVAVLHQQQPAPPQQNFIAEAQAAQRFFRVPFAKPANQYRSNEYKKSGWW